MTDRPAIVGSPEEVTSQWLTHVLKWANAHSKEKSGTPPTVADFTSQQVGTGQVGQNVRFNLTYDRDDTASVANPKSAPKSTPKSAPNSIVGKFASGDPVSRETGIAQNNYLKEVLFYKELCPSLAIQTPQVLFTDINPGSHAFCLMMEDLAPAQQGNQLEGCSLSEARLAVTQAARLHAPRWGDALEGNTWIGRPDPANADMLQGLWQQVYPGFLERYHSRLAPEHLAVAEAFGERLTNYSLGYKGPLTVIHGDFRLDNMMFGGPYPLAVVDWQTVNLGAGAQDVAYFVSAAMAPAARAEHERSLFELWHAELTRMGVDDYPMDTAWDHYRRFSFAGLMMAVIASMIVGQTPRGDDMFMVMFTGSAQQAIDLDAISLL